MEVGDKVRWQAVNGPVEGVLQERLKHDNWLVSTERNKVVIVNEKSFLNGQGRELVEA